MSQRWHDFRDHFAGKRLDGISYQIDSSVGSVVASSNGPKASDNSKQPILPNDVSEDYQLYLPIVSQE